LGIVGAGRVGRAVAAKAPAFGMRVVYHDAASSSAPDAAGPLLSLEELLRTSDVISLHVPATAETRHMIDRKTLTRMKRTAYLINTARGSVIDEDALAWALSERLIAAAALDVFEHEPRVPSALRSLENVVLIPHLGSATSETRTAMAELAARNVVAVLSGRAPLTQVA
jgi:lactate dehydrogenase-like 2-hydroxyacid dehydrogenase